MGYVKPTRFSSFTNPALVAAVITSLLACYAFSTGIYFGAFYWPEPMKMLLFVPVMLFLAIPISIFAMLAVWPVAVASSEIADRLVHHLKPRHDWPVWLLTGAVIGGPALFLYSFPLQLGQAMLGPLLLNGALIGVFCAALVRKFAGPQIDDAAVLLDDERTDDAV
ncbi:MAG: hypothetical protein J0I80_01415 [Sphingomonas sp.]|nr:hypothetical protein [Sphingomonas sp.]